MGTNNLTTKSNGETIIVTDPNQYKEALVEDIVPRALSGTPEAGAGNCGTPALPFKSVYIQGSIVNNGTVVTKEYTSTDTWEAPDKVTSVKVIACGGGGAGSTTLTSCGGGGGGVASADVQVVPGNDYAITIASGSADFNSQLTGNIGEAAGIYGAGGLGGTFSIDSTLIGYGCHGGTGGNGFYLGSSGSPVGGAGGTGYSGRGGRGNRDGSLTAYGAGGGGYGNGSDASSSYSGGGGGYTDASGTTGGAAGVILQYYLPSDVTDPN